MNIPDTDLLLRYFQGAATPEEVEFVHEWESQSAENRNVLEQVCLISQSTGILQNMQEADPEKALLELNRKIGSYNRKMVLRKTRTVIQRVAAILFLPALLLSGYLLLQNQNAQQRWIDVKTKHGMVSSFELPDGSSVWLNSGGELRYPEKFSSKVREVELKGQGYFNITKDAAKPFFVKIGTSYSVEVLGTEFNVTAYEDDHLIETTLISGKVRLNISDENGELMQRILKPNEKAIYDRHTQLLTISTVNPEYDMVWKDGKIIFKEHSMEQVMKVLSRHYNIRFEVTDPKVLQSKITAKFTNEPLMQVLEYLNLASDIVFNVSSPGRIDNDTLQVSVIELSK